MPFYAVFTVVVGTYIVLGGMAAAAVNEGLQSVLIIVFSVLLLSHRPRRHRRLVGPGAQGAKADVRSFRRRRFPVRPAPPARRMNTDDTPRKFDGWAILPGAFLPPASP